MNSAEALQRRSMGLNSRPRWSMHTIWIMHAKPVNPTKVLHTHIYVERIVRQAPIKFTPWLSSRVEELRDPNGLLELKF